MNCVTAKHKIINTSSECAFNEGRLTENSFSGQWLENVDEKTQTDFLLCAVFFSIPLHFYLCHQRFPFTDKQLSTFLFICCCPVPSTFYQFAFLLFHLLHGQENTLEHWIPFCVCKGKILLNVLFFNSTHKKHFYLF